MGAGGRARYEQDFTLDHIVRRTLAVYDDVLGTSFRLRASEGRAGHGRGASRRSGKY